MIMHPAHKKPKYDAVYRFLCGLAERDLPCPQMRDVAAMVGLTQFSVGNAFYALRKAGLIRTESGYTGHGRRYIIVEIVASGKRTGHLSDIPHNDLPSDGQSNESAGGPRVVSAIDPVPDRLPPCATAAEPIRPAPPPLSHTGRWRGLNVGPDSNVPDIERIRQINAALPKAVAIPASWDCQWIESADGEWPPVYCGAPRCHEDSPYCAHHHGRAFTGKLKHHAALTPEERAKRIERGRKIKAAMARKRDIEERRERQHQPGA